MQKIGKRMVAGTLLIATVCLGATNVCASNKDITSEISSRNIAQNDDGIKQTETRKRICYLLKGGKNNEILKKKNQLAEVDLLAQLIQAEAGNQGLTGMRYVADVVLNRIDSPRFAANSIKEVIYSPGQFSVMRNGAFKRAGKNISEEAYEAAYMEIKATERLDSGILYFSSTTNPVNGKGAWKYKQHWFSY